MKIDESVQSVMNAMFNGITTFKGLAEEFSEESKFSIRAILALMEENGWITPISKGHSPRLLITKEQWEELMKEKVDDRVTSLRNSILNNLLASKRKGNLFKYYSVKTFMESHSLIQGRDSLLVDEVLIHFINNGLMKYESVLDENGVNRVRYRVNWDNVKLPDEESNGTEEATWWATSLKSYGNPRITVIVPPQIRKMIKGIALHELTDGKVRYMIELK